MNIGECAWCSRGVQEDDPRQQLIPQLCADCAHLQWKKIQPLATWINDLARQMGVA